MIFVDNIFAILVKLSTIDRENVLKKQMQGYLRTGAQVIQALNRRLHKEIDAVLIKDVIECEFCEIKMIFRNSVQNFLNN